MNNQNMNLSTFGNEIKVALKTPVALFFYAMAVMAILGGMSMMTDLWPDPRQLERGYEYTAEAYIPAYIALFSGFFTGAFLFWMGQVLIYLKLASLEKLNNVGGIEETNSSGVKSMLTDVEERE